MSSPRITVRPDQMGGVPCVRSLRIPVATVVDMVSDGMSEPEIVSEPEILAAYPDLEVENIREALRFAAERSDELLAAASAPASSDLKSILADLADVRSRVRGPVDAVTVVREVRQELEQREGCEEPDHRGP
jgi:uncharacterized protein (DUF433 family)